MKTSDAQMHDASQNDALTHDAQTHAAAPHDPSQRDAPLASVPRFAQWMLERMVPASDEDAVIGDLAESFHNRIANGATPGEASRWYRREAARVSFLLAAARVRRRRRTPIDSPAGDGFMYTMFSEVRFACRVLIRQPLLTFLSICTLAIGIGATTAIFSAVNPILFEPLPYPHSERIMAINELGADHTLSNTSYATYVDLVAQSHSFSAIAAMNLWTPTVTGHGDPDVLTGQHVSWTFFDVLGVAPALGRGFDQNEDVTGAARVVIISDALWRSRYGADRTLIGRTIELDGIPHTVIGVMPASFENVVSPTAQLWTTLRYNTSQPWACRTCRSIRAVGRLRENVTQAQAERELGMISHNLVRAYPKEYGAEGMPIESLRRQTTSGVGPAMLAVLAAVVLLLIIACVNVMNLLLARSAQRRGEFSVRAALGAGRVRIIRQLLTESVLLALVAGVLGMGIAAVGVKALVAMSPSDMPRLAAIRIDVHVLLFALAMTAFAGIAFGMMPALHASRKDLANGIRLSGRRMAGGGQRTRGLLVISEVALALVLLVGAGLLLRSMQHLFAVDPGFDANGVIALNIQISGPKYKEDTATWHFYESAMTAVRAVPGVQSASFVSQLPLSGDFDAFGVHREGHVNPNPELDPNAHRYVVMGDYLHTMNIPIQRGRGLTDQDRAGSEPVVLINSAFAKRAWPGEDPIGQRIHVGGDEGAWRRIVGVTGDIHQVSLAGDEENAVYLPSTQWLWADNGMWLVVRSRGNTAGLAAALRTAIWSVDPNQPITRVSAMTDMIAASATQRRFALILFECFAVVALILAAAGIYGVIAGAVAERIPEIGLRAALGASRGDIVQMVLREGVTMTAAGAAFGIVVALSLSRLIAGLLFGVTATDAATYLGVTAILGAAAILACALPAWRAARVDPAISLKAN